MQVSSRGRFLIILSMGVVFFGILTRNRDILLTSVLIDSLLLAGWGLFPRGKIENISLKRDIQTDLSQDGYRVRIVITAINRGYGTIFFSLRDNIPYPVTKGDCCSPICLGPGGEEVLSYTIECVRARIRFEEIIVITTDPLGLFEEFHSIPLARDLILFPSFTREKPFSPRRISTLSSPGTILSGKAGTGMDFLGIREYQSGDSLGRLDWRQTARHPHKFFTREFEDEKNGDFHLILDTREEILLKSEGLNLLREMVKAAASFSEILLKQGNRVSLAAVGAAVENGNARIRQKTVIPDIKPSGGYPTRFFPWGTGEYQNGEAFIPGSIHCHKSLYEQGISTFTEG